MYRQNPIIDSETCFNCMDDETDSFGNYENSAQVYDSLFGRNKQKKAEKKLKKAEKALAKGQLKKAAKKMRKAQPILNKIQQEQQQLLGAKQQLQDINQTTNVINTTDTRATESLNTSPGQIGSEAGSTTMPASLAQQQSLGGANGGMSGGGGGGDSIEDVNSTSGIETSTEDNPKDLSGVTVTSKKTNIVLIVIVAVVAIAAIFFLPKLLKGK